MKSSLRVVLFVLVAFGLFPILLRAQDVATVTGVVTDPSGSVLVDVDVTLTSASAGTRYATKTNSAGSYRITNLPPGPDYTLTLSLGGFSGYKVEHVYVNVANVTTRNATLHPGENIEITVNAAGQGATLNSEDATIGNNVQVEKLNELPVQNRLTPAALFTLQPGITLGGATTGARTDQNYVTVDGLDVNDLATGQFAEITGTAPIDSVQEFRGTVAGFTAVSGAGGGGQFQLVTNSGTNKWHGQGNIYHRDNSTTANNWFNDLAGVRAPKLVQNQFGGSVGGPIKHDKVFFFFDYTNSRIAQQSAVLRTVPLASYQAGNVSYINNSSPSCTKSSRQNTTPSCISQLTPAQVKAADPAGIGESPALYNLLKREPAPNDLTAGDGVNSGGFRFNSPLPTFQTSYVGRVDYNLTPKLRAYGRGTVTRENQNNAASEFPGDPAATLLVDRSYAYVGALEWQISATKYNQFLYGSTVQDFGFPRPSNALGTNQVTLATGTVTPFADPYSTPSNSQTRHIPIPVVQDTFTWELGRHSVTLGGSFKWINTNSRTVLDYNTYTLGLGGNVQSLNASLRPANLLPGSTTSRIQYDSAFTLGLGRVGASTANFNYDATGAALPLGTGSIRNYRYYQTQIFASDTWKVTPHFTLTYGVNYQYFSVPYEKNGIETAQSTLSFNSYIATRVAQSAAGVTTPNAVPFLTYVLGGPKNNGPGLYNPDPTNFAPKFSFAWSPSFDSKTVFNGGIGTVYDRTVVNAVQYQQDQYSYLFFQPATTNFGNSSDPVGSLRTNARYDAPPAATPPPTPKPPYTPYVTSGGNPYGLPEGQFNEMIDPNLKTPYSILANFGMQHQLPNSMLMKISWVGRYGRRLLAEADASQLIEFPDKKSGQLMSTAVGNVTQQLRAGADPTNLPAQPWFEDLLPAGLGTSNGYPNNTSLVADNVGEIINGDFADTIQALSTFGLPYNVGMASQFAGNSVYTNKGFSSYNGLLVSLQQNTVHGLTYDVNYTWSHSIDNTSLIANNPAIGGYGFICDTMRPKACRGNSDFDVTHYITSYVVYSLPFGHGRAFGASIPWALDEAIGGWDLSNIITWHSGNAWSTVSNAFVAGYANNAPALFNGDIAALRRQVHKTSGGTLTQFADPTRADNAFQGPIGFQVGTRNSLRGPQYFDLDTGVSKRFTVVPDWGLKIQLRGDAFNVLNHPNFAAPADNSPYDDITQGSNFGQLTAMNGGARVLQISARVEF